jgi:uncharacterized membrane protein (DUF373 family)
MATGQKTNKTDKANSGTLLQNALTAGSRKRIMLSIYQEIGNLIIDALIIAVLLVLLMGTVQIFARFPAMLKEDFFLTVSHNMLNDIMVVFIFVELFRVLVDYFKEERVKITYIADATLVFIFKEIWVRFSEQSFDPLRILAMSGAILAVAAVRTTAVRFSPHKTTKDDKDNPYTEQIQEV